MPPPGAAGQEQGLVTVPRVASLAERGQEWVQGALQAASHLGEDCSFTSREVTEAEAWGQSSLLQALLDPEKDTRPFPS